MPVDDYTLAAFLSGELSTRKRKTVAASLIEDRNACEVLHMACEALAAAYDTPVGRSVLQRELDRPAVQAGNRRFDRPPRRHRAEHHRNG